LGALKYNNVNTDKLENCNQGFIQDLSTDNNEILGIQTSKVRFTDSLSSQCYTLTNRKVVYTTSTFLLCDDFLINTSSIFMHEFTNNVKNKNKEQMINLLIFLISVANKHLTKPQAALKG